MNFDQEVHLRDYLYILRKREASIVVFFILSLAAAVLFTKNEKILYKAYSTILIERENANVVDFKEVMEMDSSATDYYQTQYQILKSSSLIREVVEKEKLDKDPYINGIRRGGPLKRFLRSQPFLESLLREFSKELSFEEIFIKKMLRIEPVRNSRLVQIFVTHPKAERAADLANAVAQIYIERTMAGKFSMSRQAVDLISGQLVEMKQKVTSAERKLQSYKEANNLVNLPSMHEKDEFLQQAKLELVKLQSEEAKISKRYLPKHPARIHIRSQIEGLEEKIKEEEKKNLDLGRTALDYAELEREAESSRQIYESLLKRMEETSSQAHAQTSNISIVDKAMPPLRPFSPRPFLNILIALIAGLFGGILLAFSMEYFDSTIRIPEDVEKGLGLSLLGIIPTTRKVKGAAYDELYFAPGEHSPAAESFRALRTAILFKLRHIPGSRVLAVTSANPAEGKTSVSLNLAYALQQNHLKVLLIDGDLRKPKLHNVLKVSRQKGLKDILEDNVAFTEAIQKELSEVGFDFISCGSPSERPTEILGSRKMKELLDQLKPLYDFIILDTPPFLAVADTAVLADYADGLLLITKYQSTEKRHLKDLKRRLHDAGEKIMGAVINQVSARQKDYYYQQYYYYGYGEKNKSSK